MSLAQKHHSGGNAALKQTKVILAPHRDGVDVAGVSGEGLLAGPVPHVPQLSQRVTGSGDEGVHVRGQSQGHAVSNVVGEDHLLLARLQVPQAAAGEVGCGNDVRISGVWCRLFLGLILN